MANIHVVIPTWQPNKALETINNLKVYSNESDSVKYTMVGHNIGLTFSLEPDDSIGHNITWMDRLQAGPVENMKIGGDFWLQGNHFPVDILVFCHDDFKVNAPWVEPITDLLNIPDIGLVGFHGAKGLGSPDIYRTPYQLEQLARFNPMSNMVDAEVHGKRIKLPTEVATIDGFFMAFKRAAYTAIGGWKACLEDGIIFHMYDSWAAMKCAQYGYRTFMAPVNCSHSGGATEVGMYDTYLKWCQKQGFRDGDHLHREMHKRFYNLFRGQLPVRIM